MKTRNEPDEASREVAARLEAAGGDPGRMLIGEFDADFELRMRSVVREEIASLCGLMLNRLGNSGQPGAALMRSAWGEALADFSGHTGDGEEPGVSEDHAWQQQEEAPTEPEAA